MNVLDLPGPQFLQFYALVLGAVTLLAIFTRWLMRGPDREIPGFAAKLDPYEVAYLAGGARMSVNAALASLIHSGAVSIAASGGRLRVKEPVAAPEDGLRQGVYENITGGNLSVSRIHRVAGSLTKSMSDRLRESDLALTTGQAMKARLLPAALLVPVLVLGICKIDVGMSRHKPVGFLEFLCGATVILMLAFALRPAYATRMADRLLKSMRRENAALRTAVSSAPDRVADSDVALALALFGPTVLSAGTLLTLRQVLLPAGGGSGDAGGGSGCGGGGCGGGCGGCGGS